MIWAVAWFALLNAHPLFNPDEGRYAEIPREMVASGDWLVPHLNDLVYIEKPPLQYWATAATFSAIGTSDWAARLYTGLCGFLTVLVVAFTAYRLWGVNSGWRAALMSGSTFLLVVMGHHLTLDMSLTFYLTATIAAFCLAQQGRGDASSNRLWMRIAWASAALAMLTKGLIALVLPGTALIVYSVLQGDRAVWRRLSIPSGIAILLVIAAPWFVLIQRELPQFFDFFFIREHFARYLTKISDRYEPWWYFIPVLLGGSVPWLLPAVRVLWSDWRARTPRGQFDARRFLWVWIAVTFLFFSASDSKLAPYILPIFPALALLMSRLDEQQSKRDSSLTAVGLIITGIAFVSLAAVASNVIPPSERAPLFLSLRPCVLTAGLFAIAGGCAVRFRRRSALTQTATIAASSFAVFSVLLFGSARVEPVYSGASLAAQLPFSARTAPFFSVRAYDQSVPFYLSRTLTLVDERNEMDFGLGLTPAKGIASMKDFESQWRTMDQAFALLEPQTFTELQQHNLPMVVRARNPRRLIVSRR